MNMPLDTRQLRAFSILARTGSFTRAAKELFLSQSAVSHSVKALEEDVSCRLFDRVGKRVMLTQAGEQLLLHADRILNEMGVARDSLRHLGKWGKTRLRIGASTTACHYILPSVIKDYKKNYPEALITIEPGDTPRTVQLLNENAIDLALTLRPHQEDQFQFLPLFWDELSFIVASQHAWALQNHVNRGEIPHQNYILYDKSSYTFRLIERYFKDEDVVLNTRMELGSMEAIKELVKLNLGISILATWIAEEDLADRSLVSFSLGKRKLRRQWGILVLKGRRLGLPEETFIALCRKGTEKFAKTLKDSEPVDPASSPALWTAT